MVFDTSILYVDQHEDALVFKYKEDFKDFRKFKKDIYHGQVYPHIWLKAGKGIPLLGTFLRLKGNKFYNIYEEDLQGKKTNNFCWDILEAYDKKKEKKSLRDIAEAYQNGIRQFHIDPDYFSYSGLLRLAGMESRPDRKEVIKLLFDAGVFGNAPSVKATFDLMRMQNPDFLGMFELYANKARGPARKVARKVITNLAEKMEPLEHIIVDRSILRNIPELVDDLGSMAELISGPGYSGEFIQRRNYSREPDLKDLMKEGRTFGVFASHLSALMTWDVEATEERLRRASKLI
jgi:hypothetical protein